MRLYKLFLVVAVILLIALFAYPRVSAHADTAAFQEAPEASYSQMITQFSSSYGFNGHLALAIARCESRLDPLAHNKTSTAKGIFQFLDDSWKRYSLRKWGVVKDVLDPKANIELGVWVLAQEGTTPWLSSATCWG